MNECLRSIATVRTTVGLLARRPHQPPKVRSKDETLAEGSRVLPLALGEDLVRVRVNNPDPNPKPNPNPLSLSLSLSLSQSLRAIPQILTYP